ncbi:DUF4019 domain-containing protein [Sphingomonas sp. 1P06PA]|uniref:DUF4019 domain-containing protein n=1 Tax=Sphingomonas sp. 1P06PA TaxID=554121 RepID=UPI0039A5774E
MILFAALLLMAPLPEQVGHAPAGVSAEELVAETEAYFAAKDRGDAEAAYRRLAPSVKAYLPPDLWKANLAQFNAGAGKPEGREIARLTWYDNPPEAREPGLYVAADFTGRFSGLALMCGYVMWHREADGTFRIVREEQNVLDKETAAQLAPERRAPLARQFGCPS